jgi:hypothetical protein
MNVSRRLRCLPGCAGLAFPADLWTGNRKYCNRRWTPMDADQSGLGAIENLSADADTNGW